MKHDDILNKIKAYEEKWGKLGTGSIMHSDDNTKQKHIGGKKMYTPNNEYYEFRRKVLAGKERNRLAHAATISPEELNARYFEDQIESNKLIHAGTSDYKYYNKIDLPGGGTRYFYTKAEWDAYQDGLGQQARKNQTDVKKAQSGREEAVNKSLQKAEDLKIDKQVNTAMKWNDFGRRVSWDEYNKLLDDVGWDHKKPLTDEQKNAVMDRYYKKDVKTAQSGREAAIATSQKNTPSELSKAVREINKNNTEARQKAGLETAQSGREAEIQKSQKAEQEKIEKADIQKYNNAKGDINKQMDEALKNGGPEAAADVYLKSDLYKEAVKIMRDLNKKGYDIETMSSEDIDKEYGKGTADKLHMSIKNNKINDIVMNQVLKDINNAKNTPDVKSAQSGREEAANKTSKTSKEYKEEKEYNTTGKSNNTKSGNEGTKDLQKEILDAAMQSGADLKKLASKFGVSEDYIKELAYNAGGKVFEENKKQINNAINTMSDTLKDTFKGASNNKEISNAIDKATKQFEKTLSNTFTFENGETKAPSGWKKVQHSGIGGSNMNNNIVDEYKAFQEMAKKGKERNRLAHSAVINPEELNQRYLQDVADRSILVHASQNYKYYNKIDLPNGTTRYFYTKAEWDAYQDGKGQQKKMDQQNKIKNNSMIKTLNDPQVKETAEKIKQQNNTINNIGNNNSGVKAFNEIVGNIRESAKHPDDYGKGEELDNYKPKYINFKPKTAKEIREEVFEKHGHEDFKSIENSIEEKYKKEGYDLTDEKCDPKIIAKAGNELLTEWKKLGEEIQEECGKELDKVKKAENAHKKLNAAEEAFNDIYDNEFENLSKSDRYLVLDILGLDDFEDETLNKRLGFSEDDLDGYKENDEDYGADVTERYAKALNGFIKEFKAAVKEIKGSSKDDDD